MAKRLHAYPGTVHFVNGKVTMPLDVPLLCDTRYYSYSSAECRFIRCIPLDCATDPYHTLLSGSSRWQNTSYISMWFLATSHEAAVRKIHAYPTYIGNAKHYKTCLSTSFSRYLIRLLNFLVEWGFLCKFIHGPMFLPSWGRHYSQILGELLLKGPWNDFLINFHLYRCR